MDLNLAGGTFYFGILLYRFNIEKIVDRFFPAATIFVNSLPEVRGVVNPHPSITAFGPVAEIEPTKEAIKQ
jgi:hypothetical protein